MFEAFIAATGYVTEAEQFGWSFVFHYFLSEKTKQRSQLIPNMSWWYAVARADWRHPEGRTHRLSNGWIIQSSKSREMMRWHFAAGQISGCQQKLNGRLPRKVVQRMTYIHGDRFLAGEDYHCNIWQGAFPKANTKADGFASTAPARFYEPNGYGLYQVIGNVGMVQQSRKDTIGTISFMGQPFLSNDFSRWMMPCMRHGRVVLVS